VVPFLSAVHLDEKIFNGAKNFNPWRWMEPENEVNTHIILMNTLYNFIL
jgi:cytochrome P450